MKQEKAIAKNREALKQLLMDKSSLKQDIADDCEKVFDAFKKMLQHEIDDEQWNTNKHIRRVCIYLLPNPWKHLEGNPPYYR